MVGLKKRQILSNAINVLKDMIYLKVFAEILVKIKIQEIAQNVTLIIVRNAHRIVKMSVRNA